MPKLVIETSSEETTEITEIDDAILQESISSEVEALKDDTDALDAIPASQERGTFQPPGPPWNAVGSIYTDDGWGLSLSATGTLITDRLVVTANHAIKKRSNGRLKPTVFRPGSYGQQNPWGESKVIRTHRFAWIMDDGTVTPTEMGIDFAVFVLKDPLGRKTTPWQYANWHSSFVSKRWGHIGYPASEQGKPVYHGKIPLGGIDTPVVHGVKGMRIYANVYHEGGMSGGPLYRGSNIPTLIGVLSGDYTPSPHPHHKTVFSGGPHFIGLINLARKKERE